MGDLGKELSDSFKNYLNEPFFTLGISPGYTLYKISKKNDIRNFINFLLHQTFC